MPSAKEHRRQKLPIISTRLFQTFNIKNIALTREHLTYRAADLKLYQRTGTVRGKILLVSDLECPSHPSMSDQVSMNRKQWTPKPWLFSPTISSEGLTTGLRAGSCHNKLHW
ncbi:hypothetical protein JTE90_004203 [Oedothorax gibbosus]|uniref:Uncharacterized protein n=1 Tax=Oedothorax gibbosus TaxID=931172 RepID=A0AAV6V495_9ARAC|nr:hypothetical protein JTE90_004203 [Oedothorax gibbosus]